MTKRFQMIAGMVLVGCVAFGEPQSAFCQQRNERRGTPVDSKQPNGAPHSSAGILRSSAIIGSTANFQGGTALGTVSEVVFSDSGCVEYVVVSYQNRFVPIPWMATTYNSADRILLLSIDQAQLRQIPTFLQFTELSNAQFAQKVNTFYKVDSRTSEHRVGKPVTDDRSGARQQGAQSDNQGQKPAVGTKPQADNNPPADKKPVAAAEKQPPPRKTRG
jgi:PRC-barrel domain